MIRQIVNIIGLHLSFPSFVLKENLVNLDSLLNLQERVFLARGSDVVLMGDSTKLKLPTVVTAFDLWKNFSPNNKWL